MKKILSLTLALLMLIGMFSINAFAADTTPAADATVYVTIANKGSLVAVQEAITVKDNNSDGVLTIDEALYAAHEAKYEGGVAAGYTSSVGSYGLSIDKLWGDTSYAFGYYINNASARSLADEVKDGDYVNAFVYSDLTTWSDKYCFFDKNTASGTEDGTLTLTLSYAGYDASYNSVALPVEGATITIDGVATAFKTDAEGKVTITLDKAGDVVIGATSDSMTLVPPVCKVNVVEKAPDTTPDTTPDNTDDKEPDNTVLVVCIVVAVVVVAAGAVVFVVVKRKKN